MSEFAVFVWSCIAGITGLVLLTAMIAGIIAVIVDWIKDIFKCIFG